MPFLYRFMPSSRRELIRKLSIEREICLFLPFETFSLISIVCFLILLFFTINFQCISNLFFFVFCYSFIPFDTMIYLYGGRSFVFYFSYIFSCAIQHTLFFHNIFLCVSFTKSQKNSILVSQESVSRLVVCCNSELKLNLNNYFRRAKAGTKREFRNINKIL